MVDDDLFSVAPVSAASAEPAGPPPSRQEPERFSDWFARWVCGALILLVTVGAIWLARSLSALLRSEGGWSWTGIQLTHLFPPLGVTVFAALALATRAYRGDTRSFWILSYGLVAFFVIGIVGVWIALIHQPYRPPADDIVVTTPAQLDDFLRRRLFSSKLRVQGELPIALPTGVFLKTAEFEGTENLVVTGYIWQRYADDVHEGLARAFVLPEAVDAQIEEAYRRREGSVETVGWTFQAETRQQFHYQRFPFDVKDPWVRLWHKDLDRNVVLVPDFESYASTDPRTRPGIEGRLVLPGWRIEQSFFSYKTHRYNTSFGVDAYQARSDVPELYFTMVARRQFVSTFFLLLLPLTVMLVLIFVIVYNMPPRRLGGEGLYNISRICGTYMFIMILNHVNLRQYVSGGIVYLEYFYAILYFGILWVLLNAALYLRGLNPPGIRWRENLIARVAFLPLVTGAMFVVTYLTFRR